MFEVKDMVRSLDFMSNTSKEKTWKQCRPAIDPNKNKDQLIEVYKPFTKEPGPAHNASKRREFMVAFFQWLQPEWTREKFMTLLGNITKQTCGALLLQDKPPTTNQLHYHVDMILWHMILEGVIKEDPPPPSPWHHTSFDEDAYYVGEAHEYIECKREAKAKKQERPHAREQAMQQAMQQAMEETAGIIDREDLA